MNYEEAKTIVEPLLASGVVPATNAIYALVVWKEDSRNPIIIRSQAPLFAPDPGENFEAIQSSVSLGGKIEFKNTIVTNNGNNLNVTTYVGLV